jgi:hypothetical protein
LRAILKPGFRTAAIYQRIRAASEKSPRKMRAKRFFSTAKLV